MNEQSKDINNLINTLSKKLGTQPETLKKAAQTGEVNNLFKNMDSKQASKLQKVLSDENSAKKLLDTPQAKALMKKLMGDK